MNPYLKPSPNPHRVQLAVTLKPLYQALYRRAPVVDHLPFGGLRSFAKQLLMLSVRENDRLCQVLPTDDMVEMPAGIRGVGYDVIRVEPKADWGFRRGCRCRRLGR